jgi:glycosyltransferase involved in cell wall biosynthesis
LYNANSTTLFYDFAPRLKADRPDIRIVDHLYDHRIGYIDRYTPQLLDHVDSCVAENHRIAEVLNTDQGWPAERTPVIWPCGRPPEAFPPVSERARVRRWIRTEFGIEAGDLIILTAARMHPQKRPLDLVRLAESVRDLEHVHFLVVGGGELEDEVDEAVSRSRARIRRLPFRTDIPELIVGSDVGCLVSDFEGLPVFMLECLQASTPFLGTDVGDMGEVLRRTEAGIVVDQPGDLAALETAVRRMADPDEWARLARNAEAAGPQFEPSVCAGLYSQVFLGPNP